jgi:anthranilate phosphoribosyltransferase
LGSDHVLVVHARDGLDEISIGAETEVAELKDGEIRRYRLAPEQFGFSRAGLDAIRVEDPAGSLVMLRGVLADRPGPARDIVMLNAGAAIYAAGRAESLEVGLDLADAAITSGEAARRLERLVDLTRQLAPDA